MLLKEKILGLTENKDKTDFEKTFIYEIEK